MLYYRHFHVEKISENEFFLQTTRMLVELNPTSGLLEVFFENSNFFFLHYNLNFLKGISSFIRISKISRRIDRNPKC